MITQLNLFHPPTKPNYQSLQSFQGPCYDKTLDRTRLSNQFERIFNLMKDGKYRTLREIATVTGDPEASISAQLRFTKRQEFGAHDLNKRRRGIETRGVWEYRLIVNL